MATWPGGSCCSFCCCAAVLGVITLKPEATSMLSLFWVLLVVAQPTVNANRAMTLIMLNEVRICFIFMGSFQFWFDFVSTIIRIQVFLNYVLFCFTFVTLLSHFCHFPKRGRARPANPSKLSKTDERNSDTWFHVSDAVREAALYPCSFPCAFTPMGL